jgi:E3 ubiquitin-protein ligase BRE1
MLQRSKDALENSIKAISKTNPDVATAVQSVAEARAKCQELQERLDKMEAIYGSAAIASFSPDVRQLGEQLQQKEEELRRAKLELKASLEVIYLT